MGPRSDAVAPRSLYGNGTACMLKKQHARHEGSPDGDPPPPGHRADLPLLIRGAGQRQGGPDGQALEMLGLLSSSCWTTGNAMSSREVPVG